MNNLGKKTYEVELTPQAELFYSQDNDYGVFEVTLLKTKSEMNETDSRITVVGTTPYLQRNSTYVATLSEIQHKKYGKQYKIENIYEKTPTSIDEQKDYLLTVLTPIQVNNLFNAYPNEENILELIVEGKVDVSKVTGLGEATYEKVKQKVEENLKYREALVELTVKFGLTSNLVKKLVDVYKSASVLLDRIYENPFELIEKVNGIGFKKADEIALLAGIEKDSPYRIMASVKHLLKENQQNGHCFMMKDKLFTNMYALLSVNKSKIKNVFDTNAEDDPTLYIEGNTIGLIEVYKSEVLLKEHLEQLLKRSSEQVINNIDEKIINVELEQGFNFTDEQKNAIKLACKYNVLLLAGKAGTGKTSVMKGILKVLLGAREGIRFETCAFSGKASQRITESTGYKSKTIHRLLGFGQGGNMWFSFDKDNPLPTDIVVLDEASMVNSTIFSALVEAVPLDAKIIIMGDIAQLEAIGEGFVFGDLLASKKFPTVELTKVHRQALKSGTLKVANEVREGINFLTDIEMKYQRLGELQDLHLIPCKEQENVFKNVIKIAKKYKGDIMDFQVIVPTKKRGILSCNELNKYLQDIFNPADENTVKLNMFGIEFREKDKIITKGNDYSKLVFNGTLGTITYIDKSNQVAIITFEDGASHEYSFKDFEKIELGYALTIHRCQGSQFKYCVIGIDNSSWIMLSRQILYTALTRTIDQCFLVGQVQSINKCIKTNNSSKRLTYLPKLLKDMEKIKTD